MTWYRSFSVTELIFVGIFLLFYSIYIWRVIRIATSLNTGFNGIFFKVVIRTIYFALLIIALLGPAFGEARREVQSVGKDIFLAIDLSQSMNANDVQPTRLEKMKFELKNIVGTFTSDRIGLIIFSSEAFMQCPLTYDQNALNLFIETLHSGLVPNTGTDFGPPLKMALEKLNDENSKLSNLKSKIIVLISDGEDFGDETDQIIDKIENQGIKLFTLGIGTEKGSKIRTGSGFKRDKDGNEVVSRLDARSLKAIAAKTDGKYFEINESNNDVQRLKNTINSIEGEVRDSRQVDISANKYFYFLVVALLLMLVDIFTSFKTIRI
jgi:Ca-activated chloride channel family protein